MGKNVIFLIRILSPKNRSGFQMIVISFRKQVDEGLESLQNNFHPSGSFTGVIKLKSGYRKNQKIYFGRIMK